MFGYIKSFFLKPKKLDSFDTKLTRENLIQGGRILVVDDEKPLLIDELSKEGFAVDHDTTGSDLHKLENQIYDIVILDYHGVGQRLGETQGMGLMKYIKRVSPRTRIIAYTSRSLSAAESEFFTMSHTVLRKDEGLVDSLEIVESELRKAFSKEHLFESLIAKLNVVSPEEKDKIRAELIKTMSTKDESKFKSVIVRIVGDTAGKAVEIIVKHLFESLK